MEEKSGPMLEKSQILGVLEVPLKFILNYTTSIYVLSTLFVNIKQCLQGKLFQRCATLDIKELFRILQKMQILPFVPLKTQYYGSFLTRRHP